MATKSLTNSRSRDTCYSPGNYYDASRGITVRQFEDPNNIAKACITESGFLRDPSAIAKAIIVANLSGQDLVVVCDRPTKLNRSLPAVRENEKELDGIPLPSGCVTHFNVPPCCFNVSVKQKLITENGREAYESRQGVPFNHLGNKIITYTDGSPNGLITDGLSNGKLDGYTYVNNYSSRPVSIKITKTNTAYELSEDEQMESKLSRLPDGGGQVVHKQIIKPGGEWHVKNQRLGWTIRALQPECLNEDNTILSTGYGVPSVENYVELANTCATNSQYAIIFADQARNSGIVMKTYSSNEIKPVDSDISITGPGNS